MNEIIGTDKPDKNKVTDNQTAYILINDVNQLQAMNTNLAGNYKLGRNVDASATASWNSGAGFEPIGSWDYPFTGVFDGNGYVISNLTIKNPPPTNSNFFSSVGLFGTAAGAAIRNVGLTNMHISGSDNTYNNNVGGLVGINYNNSTITNCYTTGVLAGNLNEGDGWSAINIGGLVGMNYGSITDSYSTAAVTGGNLDTSVGPDAGGLVGRNYYTGTITNSYSTGAVSGTGFASTVGGLVGGNQGKITNSYSIGTVSATGLGPYAGGLVGTHGYGSTISCCYSTGSIKGTGDYGRVGGLAGSSYGNITSSYWDTQTSGYSNGVGYGDSSSVTGLSTAKMMQKSSYIGWDFTNIWNITSSYPFLRWQ